MNTPADLPVPITPTELATITDTLTVLMRLGLDPTLPDPVRTACQEAAGTLNRAAQAAFRAHTERTDPTR